MNSAIRTVTLNEKGVAHYAFADDAAWEQLAVTNSALTAISGAQAVCFGTLGGIAQSGCA